jgi:hypothetical protein
VQPRDDDDGGDDGGRHRRAPPSERKPLAPKSERSLLHERGLL